MKHVILGAGGSIGNALTYELLKNNEKVRLVSRSNFSIKGTEAFKADVLSYNQTVDCVKDAGIVYLCVGLPYDRNIWKDQWPKIMQNVIDACKLSGSKLIFFDNVYMYGKVVGKMTEDTIYNPCSVKGEIRAKIAMKLEHEMKQNNLKAIIARSADFYGPYATLNSVPYIMALEKLLNGKKAQWLANDSKTHSYTYTLDCAKALLLLGKDEQNFQQIWHLPTTNPGITGKKFIEIAAKELRMSPNHKVLKKWLVKIGGIFNTTIYESLEMLYQNENEYYFDSSKFNKKFNFVPTSYESGIKDTIEFYKKK